MMVVDFQIALADNLKVEQSVLCKQLEHVIEKGQPRHDARLAIAVEIELDAHVSLFRLALNSRLSFRRSYWLSFLHSYHLRTPNISRNDSSKRSFSSGVPTLKR